MVMALTKGGLSTTIHLEPVISVARERTEEALQRVLPDLPVLRVVFYRRTEKIGVIKQKRTQQHEDEPVLGLT